MTTPDPSREAVSSRKINKALPPSIYLRECLEYDEVSGNLTWKYRPFYHFKGGGEAAMRSNAARWNTRFAGKAAFTYTMKNGYRQGSLDGVSYLAHRIIFKLVHGFDPELIDHQNGIRCDNSIANLKSVTPQGNAKNMGRSTNNTTGVVGVHYRTKMGVWRAEIRHQGRAVHIGAFKEFDDAVRARKLAEVKYGYHSNHGKARQV